ncbi:NAD(P)-dependent oxidoreductase [Embleya scabrispora]|uniref:NAD(P)-dependent oxidoreductase n=1 Tax=Embleya scabrispora TaxID=159449 RepID=UPI0003644B60|nr:NAD(P)H-binding protein [Embleya scabrispora]MYS86043.1 NAD(P)H-binding protein [Streptomyces sp. SID5474]
MRITVFGATGPTGRRLTDQALAAGHRVTAVSRRVDALPLRAGLTVAAVDVADTAAVAAAVAGSDAVVSALGVPPTRERVTVYSDGVRNILAGMEQHGVKRLVAVSSSVADPNWRPTGEHFFNLVMDPLVNRKVARTAHDDMRRMEALMRESGLDWTVVRPGGLFEHPEVTDYELGEHSVDGLYTARTDLAAAMLSELEDRRFVRKAMGVATRDVEMSIPKLIRQQVKARKAAGK